MPRLVDLSQPWSSGTPPFPTDPAPTVEWVKRLQTHGTNHQRIATTLHVGTHIDAPLHWNDGGDDVASIPLERLFGPAVVADVRHVGDHGLIRPTDVTSRVDVRDEDILILHTGFHRMYAGGPDEDIVRYFFEHPGLSAELTEWIVTKRLRWVGMDMGSADHPMNSNVRSLRPELARRAEAVLGAELGQIFPHETFQLVHARLCGAGVPIVENLGPAVEQLVGRRILAGAFPWRFAGGEAAFARVVAFV